MLDKSYVRRERSQVIGSVATGFTGSFEKVVRDGQDKVLGATRDEQGKLLSVNRAIPGLRLSRKK